MLSEAGEKEQEYSLCVFLFLTMSLVDSEWQVKL